jgi:hypothetical protein
MEDALERVYTRLLAWSSERGYAGHDPFDGLSSRIFQATPLRHSRYARLIWTQLLKRSPVDLRGLALVQTGRNAKGIALFALAEVARFRTTGHEDHAQEAHKLLSALIASRLEEKGWGYNFDWQGRSFFAPKGTPAAVPTAFAVRALIEATDALGDRSGEYLSHARRACDFILHDLNRTHDTRDELCFSYTPLDHTRVFNASLLAAESLAMVGARSGENDLVDTAARATCYVIRRQSDDGSWTYGEDSFQSWADNFHTAFILTSLSRIKRQLSRGNQVADLHDEITHALRRGFDFWRANFFLANGWPKYFPNRQYPADAHSAAASVVACAELAEEVPGARDLAESVMAWSISELLQPPGFFAYQRRRFHTVRMPFMRWSQAWMAYALARMLEMKSPPVESRQTSAQASIA